jgi:hypothetical protein
MPRFGLVLWIALCATVLAEQDVTWPTEKRIEFLYRYYSSTESSHFVDLWESQTLKSIAIAGGLSDTHTLFVNAHGKQVKTPRGKRYVLYPHEAVVTNGATPLLYLEDLAMLLGPTNTASIHNLVLGACNVEGAIDLAALRASFVNATNIIHMPSGKEGYQPMLFQALLSESSRIEPLYELRIETEAGTEYEIQNRPALGATKLSPYIASLFRSGETRPYRTQIAGRELLLPAASGLSRLAEK